MSEFYFHIPIISGRSLVLRQPGRQSLLLSLSRPSRFVYPLNLHVFQLGSQFVHSSTVDSMKDCRTALQRIDNTQCSLKL